MPIPAEGLTHVPSVQRPDATNNYDLLPTSAEDNGPILDPTKDAAFNDWEAAYHRDAAKKSGGMGGGGMGGAH